VVTRVVCVLVLATSSADAEDVVERLELGGGTAVPLDAGAQATFRATDRFDVDAAVGIMPPPYVDLINSTVVAFGGYDDTTASLIKAALDKSLIVRLGAGVRPFAFPLAFHAGYTVALLGGGVSGADAIQAVTGEDVRGDAGPTVTIHSTLHMVYAGASWRFRLSPALVLRVGLAYTQPFASSSGIDPPARAPPRGGPLDRANAKLDAYMNDVYVSYVKAPVIDISLRWAPTRAPAAR
jgi:hypothetical protein